MFPGGLGEGLPWELRIFPAVVSWPMESEEVGEAAGSFLRGRMEWGVAVQWTVFGEGVI